MGNALEAVLRLKSDEAARQQQASENLTQGLQMLQNARQQAQANQITMLQQAQQQKLQDAQIANYQSESEKRQQEINASNKRNTILDQVLNGNKMGGSGFSVKTIDDTGKMTFEKTPDPINNGVPLTSIDDIQDSNMKSLVKGVIDYKIDPSKSTSLRGDQRQKLVEMASTLDPTYDQTQFPARMQFRKNLTSGVLSKGIISANTIIGHLDSLNKSFDELNKARFNNDYPLLNSIENTVLSASGKSAATNAKLNADAVANEMETLFRGTGGSGSLTGVQEFKKNFSLASSPEQQRGIINKAIDLVASRINAVDDLHNNVMGKPRDFSVLNDKSKKIIAKLGIDPNMIDSVGAANDTKAPFAVGQMYNGEKITNVKKIK